MMFGKTSVPASPETDRIARLPRRVWSDADAEVLARAMTRELKTPGGDMSLRPVQAVALYEALERGGAFLPLGCGLGKTLISLLAPVVLEARRPLLLLPAALLEKTDYERATLARHWRIPTNLQTMSYEILGQVSCAEKLTYIRPDMLIADECHKLKGHRAARTRRVARYMRENPDTKVVAMSGTIMKSSLKDFGHLLRWCLKGGAPIPEGDDELGLWADALDEMSNPLARVKPGAIFDLGARPAGGDALSAARQIFQARLLETPGVVSAGDAEGVGASLYVNAVEYDVAPITNTHIQKLREEWETPDCWAFSEALLLRQHALSLALGFHSIWDPRPPQEWLAARREWATFVRETLQHSRTLDSELQVTNACDRGDLFSPALADWRAIKDTFTVNPKAVWHDDSALETCAGWLKRNTGIVWTNHVFFAKALAKRTGVAYYGADGLTAAGDSIVHVTGENSIIASIASSGTGRNLQMFSKNLVTAPPPGAMGMEQLIARTHRTGQRADEVTVDILLGCKEHFDAFQNTLNATGAAQDLLGGAQKLLSSNLSWPSSVDNKQGARWGLRKSK